MSGAVRRMSRPRPRRSSPTGFPPPAAGTRAEAQLADRLALQVGDHPREGAPDLLSGVGAQLLPVQTADVIGLEDLGRDAHVALVLVPPQPSRVAVTPVRRTQTVRP